MSVPNLKLTCAGCGAHIDVAAERRLHRCPHCGALSYLNPGTHTLFLRLLNERGSTNELMAELARRENDLYNSLANLRAGERRLQDEYAEDSQRSTATFRILVMSFIIAAVSALLIFGDVPTRLFIVSVTAAVFLMFGAIALMILQSTNLRSQEFRISEAARARSGVQKKLQELRGEIDLRAVGSSGNGGARRGPLREEHDSPEPSEPVH